MEEKGKSSPSLDVRTVLLVVTVLGGAYLIPTSLQSSRPGEKESLERTAVGDQVVQARLWQDPFEATKTYREKNKETIDGESKSPAEAGPERIRFHSLSELGNQILRQARLESGETTNFRPVTILEVMMSGGSYAEDAELRRRSRYAVLSALSVAGYVPWDAEHIGYAEEPWPRGKELERWSKDRVSSLVSTPKQNGSRLIVPFEWFVHNQLANRGNSSSVLVLWLNENTFADHPAKRLAQFNHFLRSQIKDGSECSAKNSLTNITRIKLLDPRLHSMLNEQFGTGTNPLAGTGQSNNLISLSAELANVELYSSWSTTADAVLTTNSGWPRRSSISRQLSALGWGTNFFNATCTDDELAEELIDELALRGTDVANGKDAVALISEWDTFYGRALPLTFAAMVKCRMEDTLTKQAIIHPDKIIAMLSSANSKLSYSNLLTHAFKETHRALQSKLPDLTDSLVTDCNRIIQQGCPMVERLQIFTTNPATKLLIASRTNLSKGKLIHLNRLLLEDAFPGSIKTNRFADAVESLRTNRAGWPSNIFRYTYLRGVDGKVPGAVQPESKSGKEQSKEKDKNDASDESARPEGHGQLDYLPRMLDRLAAREGAYEHRGRGELKAIGVLGSDVYDKLLLLQSLRPRFKDELFFTTDLDARLFHPRELKWSRNVIVASSFGLMLKRLQQEVLPFRDTYQTGEYLACLAALGYPPAVTNLTFLAPRRFEIGRNGAFDLSVSAAILHQRAPWQRRAEFFETLPWIPWLLVVGMGVFLLWHYTPRKRRTAGTTDPVRFSTDDITDFPMLACKLKQPSESDSVSQYLSSQFTGTTSELLSRYQGGSDPELQQALVEDLNTIIGRGIYDSDRFKDVKLWPETKKLLGQNHRGNGLVRLNRLLLEDSYPLEIAESGKVRQWTAWACIISILVLLSLSGVVCFDHFRIEGQPFALTEGISIWPTELIRVAAAGLAAVFFFRSRSKLLQTKKEWIREYGLPAIMTRKGVQKLWQDPDARRKWGGWEPQETGGGPAWRYLRWISIANWEVKMTGADIGGDRDNAGCGDEPAWSKGADGSEHPRIRVDELCKGYNLLGFWWHRVYRLTLPILGFLVLSLAIGHLFTPFTPSRGVWSFWVERFAVCVSFILQTVLILFVVDASRLCRKFVENLTEAETQWPEKTCQIFEDKLGLNRDFLNEYITVKVIAERTEAVGKLIFYPFLILLLTIVSRSSYFDRWHWPVSLIVVYGLSSLLAVYAVWQLRGAAEEARESALASLNKKLFRALGGKPKTDKKVPQQDTAAPAGAAQKGEKERPEQSPDGKNLVEQLRILIRKIESCEEGAFAPVTRQPVVRALLMPVGGAGLVALLQFLASKQ